MKKNWMNTYIREKYDEALEKSAIRAQLSRAQDGTRRWAH